MAKINCVVVTPEETLLDEQCEFVVVPLHDGELGIAPGHSPLIGRLGYGELRLRTGGQTQRYYVDGGFVQVLNNVVTILTNMAMPVSEIDLEAAREALRTATYRRAPNAEALKEREQAVARARAQVRAAERR